MNATGNEFVDSVADGEFRGTAARWGCRKPRAPSTVVRPGLRLILPKGFTAGQLAAHFRKHAAEWVPPMSSEAEYLRRASDLLSFPSGGSILEKIRPNGDILRYNPATNEFAVMAADGTIRTCFRPADGINYWNRQ